MAFVSIREWITKQRHTRIRRAFDRLYTVQPQRAIEHANALLDEASRGEERRAISLGQS